MPSASSLRLSWTAGDAKAAIRNAPVVGLETLCPPGTILIVAPHPDDESLGCGGLIATASREGRRLHVVILTDGAASHPGSLRLPPDRLARLRRREACSAVRRLSDGRATISFFAAPDGRLRDHVDPASTWVEGIAARDDVGSIFTTWEADPHHDHQAAFDIAAGAARRRRTALRSYPIWGLTLPDAAPAGPRRDCVALDVSAVIEGKARAIRDHGTQTGDLVPDSAEAFRLSDDDLARHLLPGEPYLLCD